MVPDGVGWLKLKGISELIKRIAFLRGLIDDPMVKRVEKSAEEELAEAIRQAKELAAAKKAQNA